MKPLLPTFLAAAVALSAPVAPAQSLALRTLAGATSPGATNGFGSNAKFNHPAGVAADENGNIYVADSGNGVIRKITTDGKVSTFAGTPGSFGSMDGIGSAASFYWPEGIAADTSGHVYVADTANGTVRRLDEAGAATTPAGLAGTFNSFDGAGTNAQFWHPEGVTAAPDGNVYIADTWNHTVRKMTPAGVVSTIAGLAGYPGSVDGAGAKARFDRPAGIVSDSQTNLFVADSFNHTIRRIAPDGKVSTIAGMPGVWGSADGTNSAARFYLPHGITIEIDGTLLVADTGNQLLRRISFDGTNWIVSTVAGLDGIAGAVNGVGSAARLYFPLSVASDAEGYVYAADMGNNMIRTTRLVSPTLQTFVSADQLVLSWPVSAEGFTLQQSTALGPAAAWTPVTAGIVTVGDNFFRSNSVTTAAFYRLYHP
ncbi:MAG TPA: NHL repeat-containing protein [Verrucomicrobiae bacterium]|nr:NHL repeat-containing protein [Verrucomicrobiae bacterium]